MIIPAVPTSVKSYCDVEGIYEITKPCIISLGDCKISINNKYFQKEQTTHEEFVFELPSIALPNNETIKKEKIFQLKRIDEENIKQINVIANNLQSPDLNVIQNTGSHPWVNTSIILIITASALVILYILKVYPNRQKKPSRDTPEENQKIEEPLFSSLRMEEVCKQYLLM